MKLSNLVCISENVDIDEYLKLYKYVRDNMEHPEWLGTFTKDEIIEILNNGGKIWLYKKDDKLVCSMFYMPVSNESLRKHNVMYESVDTGALGPIMVSPDYLGNGLQLQMMTEFNNYCVNNGKKYIYTKAHSDNIYCIRNLIKDGFVLVDEYKSDRGMNSAFIKECESYHMDINKYYDIEYAKKKLNDYLINGREPELCIKIDGVDYMIIPLKNKISFQLFGSKEVYYDNVDDLFNSKLVNGIVLKDDWKRIEKIWFY